MNSQAATSSSSKCIEYTRLKWVLQAMESGRRENSSADGSDDGILSIGGEHLGWGGEWNFENPRYISRDFFNAMSSGVIKADDILLVKDGATIGKTAIAEKIPSNEAAVNEHVFLLRTSNDNFPKYFFYVTQSPLVQDQIWLEVRGAAQPGLNSEACSRLTVPRPIRAVQESIAGYLDREITRLDKLVEIKNRLLNLIAEKQHAIVTRAITRGLDPHIPLRDTGIPWLGRIPGHWKTTRMRFLITRIEQGWSPETANREPSTDEWGVLKLNAVNQGRFDATASKTLLPDSEPRVNLALRAGDVLVTRSNTPSLVGDACFVEIVRPRMMLCDLIYRLTLNTEFIDGRFLSYFLTLPIGRIQIESDARGTSASMVKISQKHIKDWWVPVPPKQEQRQIITQLRSKIAKIDNIRAVTERTIALLKERRAALITAAVTGTLTSET